MEHCSPSTRFLRVCDPWVYADPCPAEARSRRCSTEAVPLRARPLRCPTSRAERLTRAAPVAGGPAEALAGARAADPAPRRAAAGGAQTKKKRPAKKGGHFRASGAIHPPPSACSQGRLHGIFDGATGARRACLGSGIAQVSALSRGALEGRELRAIATVV